MSVWAVERVLGLAPDAASQRAARGLATPRPWSGTGYQPEVAVWGLCQGSGRTPYQTCVELAGPAYHCSCPSRKVPCKHALALLLRWAGGAVEEGLPPEWVQEWLAGRAERAERAAARAVAGPGRPNEKTVQRRAERVDAGLAELDRWLADQVRQGLAAAARAGYPHWDAMAARLVDAQAPGAAGAVRRLAGAARSPRTLLTELALLRLLVAGHRRRAELPAPLAATVRARIGFTVPAEEVRAAPPVRDRWHVLALRDESDDRLTTRRVWLHGASGRPALVLSFAPPGAPLDSALVPGLAYDADLRFYPGAQPLRAVVSQRYGPPEPAPPPAGEPVAGALRGYAEALSREPWLERWPLLLAGVRPVEVGGWHLVDEAGDALPLERYVAEPWPLVALSGGGPLTVAGEWTTAGLRPLAAWSPDGRLVPQ
ncbi:SWIM zinc finger family protein [Rhizomonospora bruguierae]|uniref:SWIM zinc finger family protein n=1 Tax=Rhizomonospora bruguierae TaxID=1581705 RepID=UPI001BCB60F8|nr:SWIM zinc finger family protein [Micromonospora sp. NBRC 107566]